MDQPLRDRVTIVTGASSGIGEAIARRFASAGSRLVLAARRAEKLDGLAKSLAEDGAEPLVVPTDVTKYEQMQSLIDRTIEVFGRVDVMVNNAGNAVAKPLAETSPEEIDKVLDVNLKGLCYGCRAVAPHMIKQKSGDIINIGSITSVRHYANFATYCAAKFGVLGFSRSFYEEVRPHGVRVNVLCPAAVNTPWAELAGTEQPYPADQKIQPEDLADLAFTCVTLPRRVQIEQIILWPTVQSTK